MDVMHSLSVSIASNILVLLIGHGLKKEEEANKMQNSLDYADVTLKYMGLFNLTSAIPGLRKFYDYFNIAGYSKALGTIRQFYDFIRHEIYLHKTSDDRSDIKDFMNRFLEKSKNVTSESRRHFFSEIMLEGNVAILFLGASDTVISSMGWLLRFMAKHKDIQDRAYRELMEVLGKDGKARYDERQKIPYSFAVLLESQRMSSIVPLSTTRSANQDIPIRNYIIPKGAEITANFWGLHNDPEYWDNPEEFRPERFLNDDGSLIIKQLPSYVPFSIGKRNCPGETIVWSEILIFFSEIIKNFEISTALGVEPKFKSTGLFIEHLLPQPLCFRERMHTI